MHHIILSIIRQHQCDSESKDVTTRFATQLMKDHSFVEYIEKNGYHFTDSLADHATRLMTNADNTNHNWTSAQVRTALGNLGYKVEAPSTCGDAAYDANMAYADLYPTLLKHPEDCLVHAQLTLSDPDGYDGMVFSRWLSDIIAKNIDIDWQSFIV